MKIDKLITLILKTLKDNQENNTNGFWNKMPEPEEVSDLELANTINYLNKQGLIIAQEQKGDMNNENIVFEGDVYITPMGIQYLQENSILKKTYKGLKEAIQLMSFK